MAEKASTRDGLTDGTQDAPNSRSLAPDQRLLSDNYARLRLAVADLAKQEAAVLPPIARIDRAVAALPRPGQADYLQPRGAQATLDHLVDTVVPALTGQNFCGRYYGFVIGSTLPVAEAADNVVSALDQNVHVHLPSETVCTAVEDAALQMLLDVLELRDDTSSSKPASAPTVWTGRLFTTGATASNVLGLATGREAIIRQRIRQKQGEGGNADGDDHSAVGQYGLLKACRLAGVDDIRVLTSMGHSSLYKAASIVGLGRDSVVHLPFSDAEPWRLNIDAVERALAEAKAAGDTVAHIIAVSAGEVNTGRFATTGRADMERLRHLADTYGAWLHVDGAFGLFARALPDTAEFASLRTATAGLELADSITADGHKILNVPYDTGIFYSRYRHIQTEVFRNPNAAYLMTATKATAAAAPSAASATAASAPVVDDVATPLNMGIENSRRFRALPVYAVLMSEGRTGLAEILVRMVRLARGVRRYLCESVAYECLPNGDGKDDAETDEAKTHIVVLFRAKHETLNASLAQRINATRAMYVSGTSWGGRPACRIAVSSWRVDVERDLAVIKEVLDSVAS